MIASLNCCLGDKYLTEDKAMLPWQASELSSEADQFLSAPARAGSETPDSDGCRSFLLDKTSYLGAAGIPMLGLEGGI